MNPELTTLKRSLFRLQFLSDKGIPELIKLEWDIIIRKMKSLNAEDAVGFLNLLNNWKEMYQLEKSKFDEESELIMAIVDAEMETIH